METREHLDADIRVKMQRSGGNAVWVKHVNPIDPVLHFGVKVRGLVREGTMMCLYRGKIWTAMENALQVGIGTECTHQENELLNGIEEDYRVDGGNRGHNLDKNNFTEQLELIQLNEGAFDVMGVSVPVCPLPLPPPGVMTAEEILAPAVTVLRLESDTPAISPQLPWLWEEVGEDIDWHQDHQSHHLAVPQLPWLRDEVTCDIEWKQEHQSHDLVEERRLEYQTPA